MRHIGNLFSYRDLLVSWVSRTIRARYKQSILGGLWAIIQPVATVIMFSLIFTLFIPVDTGDIPYVVFSYSAMVPWLLFTSSITDMVESLVSNSNLVSKIYFPREILPIASLLARLVDFTIAYAVLLLLMIIYRVDVFLLGWILLPFVLIIQLALSLGIGLLGASLNVFYRDVRHIITLVLQLWFYATPIIYPVTVVPEELLPIYYINPMVGVIEAYRSILLAQQLPDSNILISAAMAVSVLLIGYWWFKRTEPKFADII